MDQSNFVENTLDLRPILSPSFVMFSVSIEDEHRMLCQSANTVVLKRFERIQMTNETMMKTVDWLSFSSTNVHLYYFLSLTRE
jgi:hypothetical protein